MNIGRWFREQIRNIYKSIAFIPFLVILFFLVLSASMIFLDYSETGKHLKGTIEWIRLKDPSTARTLVSVIAGGLISLTVFSFSMVMVVLNQAASQLTNRVLGNLIGSRLQQFILGYYIGTIIYSLLLLSSIRENETGIFVPALSTYLLMLLSVIAIFLFVFFLHFITQSIKYVVIINRIYKQTITTLKRLCQLEIEPTNVSPFIGKILYAEKNGVFETYDQSLLLKILSNHNYKLSFKITPGDFVLSGQPIADVQVNERELSTELCEKIHTQISLVDEPSIDNNYYTGFRQLSEIAVKALSPGINDPGTAAESLRSLTVLLSYRIQHFPENTIRDEDGVVRILTQEKCFDEIFEESVLPIWDYGKHDRNLRKELSDLLIKLQRIGDSPAIRKLLAKIQSHEHRI